MRSLLLPFFLFFALAVSAQDEPATIKFRKTSDLHKAVLDNTEGRLMVVDRFGNPRDNQIASFRLTVKSKNDTREFIGRGNALSPEILRYLNSQKSAVKIFFTELTAVDEQEHMVKLPDLIEVWFPNCRNCETRKR